MATTWNINKWLKTINTHNGLYTYTTRSIHSIVVMWNCTHTHTLKYNCRAKCLSQKYSLKVTQKNHKRIHPLIRCILRPFSFYGLWPGVLMHYLKVVYIILLFLFLSLPLARYLHPFFTLINYKSYAIGIQKKRVDMSYTIENKNQPVKEKKGQRASAAQ